MKSYLQKGKYMLRVGDKIPDFELPDQDEKIIRFSDYRGKRVVLFAFPKAGTRGCTKQACVYRDTYEEFEQNNTVILGITSNPAKALRKWRDHHNFPYDLLSDTRHEVLDELGAWGQPMIAGIELPMANRSYWVIDETGIIIEAQVGVNPEKSVYESLNFIQQLEK